MSGMISLDTLDEDILILVLSYLAVDDLLSLRQTCHRLHKTTHLRIVWRNACLYNILLKGFPFPSNSSNGSGEWALDGDGSSSRDLERYTRLASRLAGRWLATLSATTEKPPRQPWQQQQLVDSHGDAFPRVDALAQSISSSASTTSLDTDTASLTPRTPNDPQQQLNWLPLTKETNFTTSSSTEITYVRFLPGRKERYILVVSKGIWSTLSLWEIEGPHLSSTSGANTSRTGKTARTRTLPRERASWSLKGGLFSRFVVNEDVTSEAVVAVSVYAEGRHKTVILGVEGLGGNEKEKTKDEADDTDDSGCCLVGLQTSETVTAGDGDEKEDENVNEDDDENNIKLSMISTVDTDMEAMEMVGDVIAFAEKSSKTVLFDWKTGKTGLLQHEPEDGVFKHDPCVQIVFAHHSVLVVRARSLHLFPRPKMVGSDEVTPTLPMAKHSFGWVDGISIAIRAKYSYSESEASQGYGEYTPITILCRAPNHDPWSANVCTFDLYVLSPNPNFVPPSNEEEVDGNGNDGECECPYVFPPRLTAQAKSRRGPLRCFDIVLGKYGTAVWIHPRDRASYGLISADTHLQEIPLQGSAWNDERLVAAVLAGPLRGALEDGFRAGEAGLEGEVEVKTLARKEAGSWTAFDYDEAMGRVVLGSSFGGLTVMEI